MKLHEVLAGLLDKHGLSDNQLAEAVDMSQSTITRIRNGISVDPRNGTVQPIADYFGVSLAQLRGEQPIPGLFEAGAKAEQPIGATLTPEEIDWIKMGRQLSPKHREVLRELMTVYAKMDR